MPTADPTGATAALVTDPAEHVPRSAITWATDAPDAIPVTTTGNGLGLVTETRAVLDAPGYSATALTVAMTEFWALNAGAVSAPDADDSHAAPAMPVTVRAARVGTMAATFVRLFTGNLSGVGRRW